MTAAGRILLLLTAFPMAVSGGVAGPQEPGVKSVLDKEVQRLARQTEKLRGLRFRWPVAYGVESRAHLRERMVSLVKEEWGHTGIEKMGSVLRAFRLIPPDLDLAGLLADLFTEQIAGFYDPKEKKLFLTQDGNASSSPLEGVVSKLLNLKLADLILVHELTHALDDQYFDLSRLEQGARGLEDGSVALQALEEGVATLTMMLYVLDRAGLGEEYLAGILEKMGGMGILQAMPADSILARAPAVIRRSLTFPYQGGLRFVLEQKRKGGWERINRLFRHPPISSEQILHPAKAESPRDDPKPISLPDLSSRRRQLISEGTMGELDLLSVLEQSNSEEEARHAAAGWGGDRFRLYTQGTGREDLLIWLSLWDDEGEAEEFQSSYNDVLHERFSQGGPQQVKSRDHGNRRVLRPSGKQGRLMVERRADAVLVIQGASRLVLASVSRQVWGHLREKRRQAPDEP